MSYKAIISDWNGTLFEPPTDEALNKKIAYAVLDDTKKALTRGKLWRVTDIYKLLKTKSELKRLIQQYEKGEVTLKELYKPFNENVLRGRDVALIEDAVIKYATESALMVDKRIVRPIKKVHYENGKGTGILSVSYDYSISRILQHAGFKYIFGGINIVAHTLKKDGDKAIGLTNDIYDRKAEVMEDEFFRNRGFREHDTFYLGDSEDDEPVADLLDEGNFIVPFFASDDFRERMASKHKAFVPENEGDLLKYLAAK